MSALQFPPRKEHGFVLIFTLIILVVMVLSSLGLMMMVRGGVTTSGNIAFRQAATKVADVAAEAGFQWVLTQTATQDTPLAFDLTVPDGAGYYPTASEAAANCIAASASSAAFDPKTYEFTTAGCAKSAGTVSQYQLYYVIHRMAMSGLLCSQAGAGCSGPTLVSVCPPGSPQDPQDPNFCKAGITTTHPYYRVTVKVIGPRHNSRYIQTFVY